MKKRFWALLIVALFGTAASLRWAWERYRLPQNPPFQDSQRPHSIEVNDQLVIRTAGGQLIGELGQYRDEIFAYLMFDYLRTRPALEDVELLLTYAERHGEMTYGIRAVLPNDIVSGSARLDAIVRDYPFLTTNTLVMPQALVAAQRAHTATFARAYNFPASRKLEQIAPPDIVAYARRFIRFKSTTDPRIRRQLEPVPQALSGKQAEHLAEDIVRVAGFYQLPLDFFLGIGAMENNYMNVKGDLGRGIWKGRAERGDVVLARRAGRVLVLNEAIGVWQITRETLRHTHRLYRRDMRDYEQLPVYLRPPAKLDADHVDPRVLTTYAGLLFRDLLDHFRGDVAKAVGAYNGGPGNPNPRYEEGVRLVADYARKVLEQAAALRGERVVDLQFVGAL